MNRTLLCAALSTTLSLPAFSNDIEVSLFYSEDYVSSSSILVSSEIIGFYRSLAHANDIYAANGVVVNFIPAKISEVSSAQFPDTFNVWSLLGDMESGTLEAVTDGNGHIQIGIAASSHLGRIGYGESMTEAKYTAIGAGTDYKKVAIQAGQMNRFNFINYKALLAHEIGHTFGASHDATDAGYFESGSSGENYGYAITCDDGTRSLMIHNVVSNSNSVDQKISGAAGCTDPNADMVRFFNKYIPISAGHAAKINYASMTINATEDLLNENYDIEVTRTKNIGSASTAQLHLSGTGATSGNELAPITVNFTGGSASTTVSVPFSDVHPLFNDADSYDDKVFAVAVASNEVSDVAFDLSTINTSWVGSSDNSTPTDGSGSGGGGSLGLLTMLGLGFVASRRRFFEKMNS